MTWRLRFPHFCFYFQNCLFVALLQAKLSQGTNFLKLLILVFHGNSSIILILVLSSCTMWMSSIIDVSELHVASIYRMRAKWVKARTFSISPTKLQGGRGKDGSRCQFRTIWQIDHSPTLHISALKMEAGYMCETSPALRTSTLWKGTREVSTYTINHTRARLCITISFSCSQKYV
jgi:hypothetical protein